MLSSLWNEDHTQAKSSMLVVMKVLVVDVYSEMLVPASADCW